MSAPLPIKLAVRTKFIFTSNRNAIKDIRHEAELTLRAFDGVEDALCRKQAKVSKMLGVDEDMRDWSFYMLLEHNIIVNRRIRLGVHALETGVPLEDGFNVKKDVMPSQRVDDSTLQRFQETVDHFIDSLPGFPKPWDKNRSPHPIFGNLNIHDWICMFGFHLHIHRKQAEALRLLLIEHA